MNNLITDLHLLTGKISAPAPTRSASPASLRPAAPCARSAPSRTRLPADMVVTKEEHRATSAEEIWGLPAGTIPPKPGYHTIDMFRAFTRGDVKVMWVQTTNPWVSIPNLNRIERQPGDGRFLVVSDIYPDTHHRGGRPGAARRRLGRARGRLRQLRAPHAAVGPGNRRAAGRSQGGRLADHRGRQADGHGAPVPVARRTTGTSRCSRSTASSPSGIGQGPRLLRAAARDPRTVVAGGRRQGDPLPLRRRARPVRQEDRRACISTKPRGTARKPPAGCGPTTRRPRCRTPTTRSGSRPAASSSTGTPAR